MSKTDQVDRGWAGARWWRFDFHVHTPASHDYKDPEATAAVWAEAARRAGLDAVVVTDHNGAGFIDQVKAAAPQDLAVFPGVELTTSEGAHLIVVFDRGADSDTVKGLLAQAGIPPARWGQPEALATKSFLECLQLGREAGGICIAAHADRRTTNRDTSLLEVVRPGEPLNAVLNSEDLVAAEVHEEDEARWTQLRSYPSSRRQRALVRGSDAHRLDDIGSQFTWVKATEPTLEGLRLALGDGTASVRIGGDSPNESRPASAICSITVDQAKFAGRETPMHLRLSPWLNAVIGSRGTGKSSLLEFTRLCMAQESGLPPAAQKSFDDFARQPEDRLAKGALLSDTTITVEYEKNADRYRIAWSHGSRTIERWVEGVWELETGEVGYRFPIQVFSQKQVYELAEQPQALLSVIDRSASVDLAEWLDGWKQLESRYLAVRAQTRELSAGIDEANRLDGELADLEHRITAIEAGRYQAILQDVTRIAEQRTALLDFAASISEFASSVRGLGEHAPATIDRQAFQPSRAEDEGLLASANDLESTAREVAEQIQAAGARLEGAVEQWLQSEPSNRWRHRKAEVDAAKSGMELDLANQGVGNPNEHDQLLLRRASVRERLKLIATQRGEFVAKTAQAADLLEELLGHRRRLTERRRAFVSDVLARNPHVEMAVVLMGDRDAAEQSLREALGGTQAFSNDVVGTAEVPGLLTTLYQGGSEGLESAVGATRAQLYACAMGGEPTWPVRDRRFVDLLRGLQPEALDRLAYWTPSDSVTVLYSRQGNGRQFEPIAQGSPGQKTAAILAFLLAHGSEPILLDQPEDDLDTTLIYKLIVDQMRSNKVRRQIVVATHNPNIVVNGDAEHVAVVSFAAGQTVIRRSGGLQETAVREEICTVMEGGRDAFERRYHRIAPHALSESS